MSFSHFRTILRVASGSAAVALTGLTAKLSPYITQEKLGRENLSLGTAVVKSAGNACLVVLIIQNVSAVQANLIAWDIVGQITLQHLAHPFTQQGHKMLSYLHANYIMKT